jgi:peptidoglycan hydrolase CwlO-like protein
MEEKLFMDWIMDNLFSVVITSLLSVIGTILMFQFKGIGDKMKEFNDKMALLTTSIQSLNTQVATILSDQSWHKEEITEIKSRLSHLESRKSNQQL